MLSKGIFKHKVLLFAIISLFIACNRKKTNNEGITLGSKKDTVQEIDVRGATTLFFDDMDSLSVVSTFYTDKEIDSISSYKKEFKAKYFYCGKGIVNVSLFSKLKEENIKDYNSIVNINTAHSLIINSDTLYINGREGIECYEQNDSVDIKSTIYKINLGNNFLNLIIIDSIDRIK